MRWIAPVPGVAMRYMHSHQKLSNVSAYLRSEVLRREIHEGLNVVQNWNSATGLVHFGRGGEIATNRKVSVVI